MKPLTLTDYQQAATRLKTGVAEVRAVTAIESGGKGFDEAGRVIIRFEPHLFSRYTKGKYDASHPALSFPVRKPGYPVSFRHSWELYDQAKVLDLTATRLSTSFGLFQILASNHLSCGCKTVAEFVKRVTTSEAEQLNLFCNLIDDWGLDDELRSHDWAGFARMYNGKGYKSNRYDVRLAEAYVKYKMAV